MELNEEQYLEIEKYSGINYPLEKIAMILDIDKDLFLELFHSPGSKIAYHYERGSLLAQAKIDTANLTRAIDGNQTSMQQYKKDSIAEKLHNFKIKQQYNKVESQYLELQEHIEHGTITKMPAEDVLYFDQLDFIRCLFNKYNSKNYIVTATSLKYKISKYLATKLYFECLNFFNLDNPVKVKAWANIYADRLDDMAALALEMNDVETARRCFADATKYRGVGRDTPEQIPEELLDRRAIFYTTSLKQFGIPEANRQELAAFIDALNISSLERMKLRREALIEDVPCTLYEEDAKTETND